MEDNKPLNKDEKTIDASYTTKLVENEKAMRLVAEILAGNIADIRPQLDFASPMGFFYPFAEPVLEAKGEEVVSILESLARKNILRKAFFERILRCPQCRSVNLRPTTHCHRCGSGNVARGRILEHFACKRVGLEDEFLSKGRYVCPECGQELRTMGSDYQSMGLLYKCRDCDNIFNQPAIKWSCLKCSSLAAADRVIEVNVYSYTFNEDQRNWLEFELKPKPQLIEFLQQRGYEVTENATLKGRSGAEHTIDLLATRDDGVVTYNIAIGIKLAGNEVELDDIFEFDDKTYDIGIHDKVLVVVPGLRREAEKFASLQKIKVLDVKDFDTVLASGALQPSEEVKKVPFEFKSRRDLVDYLKQRGYEVTEDATMKGRSGAEHHIDVLATRDDGIVTHQIIIGIEVAEKAVELDRVFDFDDRAYDIGIMDKVLVAVPKLSPEARQFARRQRIKVFEVKELEPSD